jgi:hypothetical protein
MTGYMAELRLDRRTIGPFKNPSQIKNWARRRLFTVVFVYKNGKRWGSISARGGEYRINREASRGE